MQFTATRQSIVDGESTTLVWDVPGGTDLRIEPAIGAVESSGSAVITPLESIEYTLAGLSNGAAFENILVIDVVPLADVAITASVVAGEAPLLVNFTPSLASTTAINRIYWDFEGDGGDVDGGLGEGPNGFDRLNDLISGRADYDVTGQDISFEYENVGTYTVRVRVLDVDGNAATATIDITVNDAEPTAKFSANPNSGGIPLSVSFAYDGEDAQGIESYAWDVDGDGEIDSTRRTYRHTYTEPGSFQPQLTITDRDNNTVTLTSDVLAITALPDPAPIVSLSLRTNAGEQPLAADFNVSVNDASRSGIVSWAWDYDGNGQIDSTSQDDTSFIYVNAGVYFPTVQVVAADGSVGVGIAQVEVLPAIELSVSADMMNPLDGDGVDFVLTTGGPLRVKIDIVDAQKHLVRNLLAMQNLPAGENRFSWDGKDNSGQLLPPGAYSPIVSYINGETIEVLSQEDETGNSIFYPSGWGGSCRYSEVDCGLLAISPNEIEPFNKKPVVYTFDIPFNARMTAYVTIFGTEDFAPATFFRDQPLAKGSYQIAWYGEGTNGKFLPLRETNGYVPAIFGITYPETTVMLMHSAEVNNLSVAPDIFFPNNGLHNSVASFTFELNQSANIILSIDDTENGVEILRKTFPNIEASLSAVVQWDGRDNTGELVAPGGYRIRVSAVDRYGLRSLPVVAMQRVRY